MGTCFADFPAVGRYDGLQRWLEKGHVVYFFLQDFRATLIPSITIVVSLIGTFAIVKIAGFSLNLLTLFALVLAIGTVVDNAIVVVETVMTKLEGGATNMRRAVSDALSEVTAACISTTLVFMAVFIPVTFMSGTTGTFFKQFGITMASSVGISTVLALTLCPALCVLLMKPNNGSEHKKGIGHYMYVAYSASYNALLSRYMKAIKRFIKKASYAWILLGVCRPSARSWQETTSVLTYNIIMYIA